MGPYFSVRAPVFSAGVHRMSSGVQSFVSGSIPMLTAGVARAAGAANGVDTKAASTAATERMIRPRMPDGSSANCGSGSVPELAPENMLRDCQESQSRSVTDPHGHTPCVRVLAADACLRLATDTVVKWWHGAAGTNDGHRRGTIEARPTSQ